MTTFNVAGFAAFIVDCPMLLAVISYVGYSYRLGSQQIAGEENCL